MKRTSAVSATLLLFSFLLPVQAEEQKNLPGVVVTQVEKSDLMGAFRVVGRIKATERVDLVPRVSGFLEERLFKEGRNVKTGEVLFRIEKASYEIKRNQASADLASAKASLKNASAELKRTRTLRQKGAASASELELAEAKRDQQKAAVMLAQAGLDSANLDLEYTSIRSPIDGRITTAKFSVGNLVTTSSGALATVVKTDPVYVEINISEKRMIEARRRGLNLENPPVAPRLILADGSVYEQKGAFDFVSPEVNQNTDTIQIRAVFPNENNLLLPGEFVHVSIEQKDAQPVLAVPQSAVQKDKEGYYVLAVDRDNKVQVRKVQLGFQEDGLWEVKAGLDAGERIIVEGLQKVQPGVQVNPVERQ